MISSSTKRSLFPEPSADLDADMHRAGPGLAVWSGFLHEFRNHLTVLMGATSELRDEVPPAVAATIGDTVFEAERNVQGLTSLVALLDASLRTVEPVIAPLGDVVDRAVRLASPAVGRLAAIVTNVPREIGVRNRGSALEGLIAALVIDLARSYVGGDHEVGRPARVRIDADVGRRGLAIEIACEGACMDPPSLSPASSAPAPTASWRRALAMELALKLEAALTIHPEDFAYVVQLR
jgi:hypothetical protein